MKILENSFDCCGCHACYNICPVQAIEMQQDKEGFLYPVIDTGKCIQCGQCRAVCPVLNPPEKHAARSAYACQAKEKQQRFSSSSGGFFAVLAQEILCRGGVVAGAAFTDDMLVEHILINSADDLFRLKGTKYVQSAIKDVYKQVKAVLEQKRLVLFSGTPCQVAGLIDYLRHPYENLVTVDLICHGVPSPGIWQEYLHCIGNGEKVIGVNFRQKVGPDDTRLTYKLENGAVIEEPKSQSLYMKGFLQNLYLRPSCFQCHFKGTDRCSDITMGDFWSEKEYHPNMADGYGTSALVLHTAKAEYWLQQLEEKMVLENATVEEIACWNECLNTCVRKDTRRNDFYNRYKNEPLMECLRELTQVPNTKKSNNVWIKTFSWMKNGLKKFLPK